MRVLVPQLLSALLVLVSAQTSETLATQPQSKLWVEGTSTVRGFECRVPEFTLAVNAEGSDAVKAVLAAKKVVKTVDLTVGTQAIDCGNGTMNNHMRHALKADETPSTIHFALATYDVARDADGVAGTMHGTLALGGATHPIDVAAVATESPDGALHIVGSYDLSMAAFDLTPPSLMFGRIKVGDKVKVRFDLVLKS